MSVRYRVRWAKEGRTRFVSARDQSSIWERAIRRADLPIAYSEGFTPHARVSFPDALPVGVASTGEYAELTFAAPIRAEHDLARLSDTLPEGMDILTYTEVPAGAPKLASLLRATLWELVWPPVDATALTTLLGRRCATLLASTSHEVVRHRHDGDRTLDVRPAVVALAVAPGPDPDGSDARTTLRAVLLNDAPTIRPSDLLVALSDEDVAQPALVRRVAQGAPEGEGVVEALSGRFEPVRSDVVAEAA
jgi:radical SAM-linked protein